MTRPQWNHTLLETKKDGLMSIFYTIPQSHCVVIQRFGKFARIQEAGLRFRIPIMEQIRRVDDWGDVANKRGFMIEQTEQQTDTEPRNCHTADNVMVRANASLYWRIVDPRKALYQVDVLPGSLSDIALNSLRSNIGAMELDKVLTERQAISDAIAADLAAPAQKWGVNLIRVEIQELTTDEDTSKAMLQQMQADRNRRAQIAEAEGRAKAEVTVAEAERDAMIIRAKGQAQATMMIAQAEKRYLQDLSGVIPKGEAAMVLAAQKYITGFEKISQAPADKVFLPNNFNGIFSVSTNGTPQRGHTPDIEPSMQ